MEDEVDRQLKIRMMIEGEKNKEHSSADEEQRHKNGQEDLLLKIGCLTRREKRRIGGDVGSLYGGGAILQATSLRRLVVQRALLLTITSS